MMVTADQAEVLATVLKALTALDGDEPICKNDEAWRIGKVELLYHGEVVGHFKPEDVWWYFEEVA